MVEIEKTEHLAAIVRMWSLSYYGVDCGMHNAVMWMSMTFFNGNLREKD